MAYNESLVKIFIKCQMQTYIDFSKIFFSLQWGYLVVQQTATSFQVQINQGFYNCSRWASQ